MRSQHIRALTFLFLANIISGFAQGITMLAIPWYLVNQLPGENGKILNATIVATVTFVSLFWGLYAGTLIDKYNRKRIFQILTVIDAVILISVASWSIIQGSVSVPAIILIYTTTIFTYNVHYPNLYAFVQELFPSKYYQKVNSAIEIQGQTTNFLGMMMGGLFISGSPSVDWWPEYLAFAPWKLQHIFLMDGLTYVVAFFLISMIPFQSDVQKIVDKGKVFDRLVQGFQYLREHKLLLLFGVCSHLIFFALLSTIQVVMPVYVSDYLREEAYILAAFKGMYALGAIIAGLLGLKANFQPLRVIKWIIVLLLISGVIYFTWASTSSVKVLLILSVVIGVCNAGARILRITFIIKLVPNRIIGRVNSFFAVLNVLCRVSFLYFLTIPFFSAAENGPNIVYACALLGIILWIGALALGTRLKDFKQQIELDRQVW